MHLLQQLVPMLSVVLFALSVDVLSRLAPQLRDHLPPLLGIPERMAGRLDAKLNRMERPAAVRATRGIISAALMIALGIILGAGLYGLVQVKNVLEAAIWFLLLRVTAPWTAARAILLSKEKDIATVARNVLDEMPLSLTAGFLTPVFYAALAALMHLPALPVAVAVVTILEATRVLVTPKKQNQPFVQVFRLLENLVGFVPSRIVVLFIALAACFTPRANPAAALRMAFAQGSKYFQPARGWPAAAFAGALNVALPTGNAAQPWLGPDNATARIDGAHVRAAIWLHAVTLGIMALVLMALMFIGVAA